MLPSSHHLSLRLLEKCPSCRSLVPRENLHILDEGEYYVLAHITCPACQAKHVASVASHPQGIIGNALPTDLSHDEAERSLGSASLDENTILELYTRIHHPDFIFQLTNK